MSHTVSGPKILGVSKSSEKEGPASRRAQLKKTSLESVKSDYQQLVDFSLYQTKDDFDFSGYTDRLGGSLVSAGIIEFGGTADHQDVACDRKHRLKIEEDLRKRKMKAEVPRLVRPMEIKLKPYQVEELKEAFNTLENGSELIEVNDVMTFIRACGFEPDREEIKEIINEIKPANKGLLTCQELMNIFEVKLKREDKIGEIRRAFRLFDVNDEGLITFDDLKEISKVIGEDLHEEEMKEMIKAADKNHIGGVTMDNFVKLMTSKEYFDE